MAVNSTRYGLVVEHLHARHEHRVPGDARLHDGHRLRQRRHDRRRDAPAVRRHEGRPATATARPATPRSTRSPSGSRSTSTTRASSSAPRSTTSERREAGKRAPPEGQATDQTTELDHAMVESAARLGVELNEGEALEWIESMKAEAKGGDIVVDVDSGVFGHRATMLDLSPRSSRASARWPPIVGVRQPRERRRPRWRCRARRPRAGSRLFPRTLDFFERIHITAPTREEACIILADVIRDKAIATMRGPTHRLAEVKFGTWDADVEKGRQAQSTAATPSAGRRPR